MMLSAGSTTSSHTSYYWDSSALIKRYIIESGSDVVTQLFTKPEVAHCTSVITHAEILATLYRLNRDRNITRHDLEKLLESFLADWLGFVVIPYDQQVQARAIKIIENSTLRGADLIHLATTAEAISLLGDLSFISFDQKLINAAKDCGINVLAA